MLRQLFQSWSDWTGDKRLTQAIQSELGRLGYAVHAARTREVRLAAIERPGWVQVYRFCVETQTNEENPHTRRSVVLHGVSRDDGRKSRIEVLLTESLAERNERLSKWSEGLIHR